jgi:hypothetical protein
MAVAALGSLSRTSRATSPLTRERSKPRSGSCRGVGGGWGVLVVRCWMQHDTAAWAPVAEAGGGDAMSLEASQPANLEVEGQATLQVCREGLDRVP